MKINFFKIRFKNLRSTVIHRIRTLNLYQSTFQNRFLLKQIFILDLHTSVTRDVMPAIERMDVTVNRWSISGSSELFNEPNLKVKAVNSQEWRGINDKKISKFQSRYRKFLMNQDGFLLTYTFSFILLFSKYKKPILGINATRYESPFTFDEKHLNELNYQLNNYKKLGVVSNNIADQDYLKLFAGIDSNYIPSLCSYTTPHKPENDTWVVLCRNLTLGKKISNIGEKIKSQDEIWGGNYTYEEFASFKGVILIPYNISTMRMFELTTAGFPIRIPSDRLLLEWSNLPGVLSELSYAQVHNQEPLKKYSNSPMDPNWVNFYSWWLERADWNQKDFFPNITRFDSLEELADDPRPFQSKLIENRNLKIANLWQDRLEKFTSQL